MTEPAPKSISLKLAEGAPSDRGGHAKQVQQRPAVARRSLIAFVAVLLLCGGFGVWRYWKSFSLADSGDSAADIELISAVSELFDAEGQDEKQSGSSQETSGSVYGRKAVIHTVSLKSSSPDSSAENTVRADVWLTGTIETDESDEPIALPPRISGDPGEGSQFR